MAQPRQQRRRRRLLAALLMLLSLCCLGGAAASAASSTDRTDGVATSTEMAAGQVPARGFTTMTAKGELQRPKILLPPVAISELGSRHHVTRLCPGRSVFSAASDSQDPAAGVFPDHFLVDGKEMPRLPDGEEMVRPLTDR